MHGLKSKLKKINKTHLQVAGVLLLVALAAALLWFNNTHSAQSIPALVGQVYFDGEYRIGDGEWHPIVEGEHISSTKGDVTLRGNFYSLTPFGEYVGVFRDEIPIAFYMDHINLTFYEGENEPCVMDVENPIYGDSVCGQIWGAYMLTSTSDTVIEILIHNPHAYGNENAIDEMLDGLRLWTGVEFGKDILENGDAQRDMGIAFMLVSLMFLGTALFSTLIHIKNSKLIWLLGLLVLFAGVYFAYSADGISFWNESVVTNTSLLGLSMMLYMMFVLMFIVSTLKKTKKVAGIAVSALGLANAVFFLLPIVSDVLFYDTWIWWIGVQLFVNFVIIICLIKEFFGASVKAKLGYLASLLPLIAFGVDVFGNYFGSWNGGVISQYAFTVLFIIAVIMVLKLIPQNINAAAKAKQLEMEKIALDAQLTESRISTMMSQIRPHFIYNTLGSIEQLCELDPQKAGELVHDFAKYLRGNFGELDNPKPILMSQEMDHVHHYVSIENVRFPDMTFSFEMNTDDFYIPALTIQPIVENAIKHGLMRLQKGGTIRVVSYDTDTEYCVSVIDDGVGFDTTQLLDERKHVGLRNIRERLRAMVGGVLEIESQEGVGTKVLIRIPKEAKK